MTTVPPPRASEVEAASKHVRDILDYGSQAVLVGLGHKTGLIAAMRDLEPSTSDQIAAAAGANERYAREWLAGMVVSGIVSYDPDRSTYWMSPGWALVLNGADTEGMAVHVQWLQALGTISSQVVPYFREGGGLPYSAYDDLDWGVSVGTDDGDAQFLDGVLPLAPELVDLLARGADVADIGCGEGHRGNVMAGAYRNSRFVGYDFLGTNIDAAEREAAEMHLTNSSFRRQDVALLDAEQAFDVITAFDAIHDQRSPRDVLSAIHRALRPGGIFLMADIRGSSRLEENIDHPFGAYMYCWSVCHCMTVSLAQGGEGLGAMWGEQRALEYLSAAGFEPLRVEKPPGDAVNSYYICTKR